MRPIGPAKTAPAPLNRALLVAVWAALCATAGYLGSLACSPPMAAPVPVEAPASEPVEPLVLPEPACDAACRQREQREAAWRAAQRSLPWFSLIEARLRAGCDPLVEVIVERAPPHPLMPGALAWTVPPAAKGQPVTISIREDLSELSACLVLMHEWAHARRVGLSIRLFYSGQRHAALVVARDNQDHGPGWGVAYSEAYRAGFLGEWVSVPPGWQSSPGQVGGIIPPGSCEEMSFMAPAAPAQGDLELVKVLGLEGYLLLFLVVSAAGAHGWFLRRMAASADCMKRSLSNIASQLPVMRVEVGERMERMEDKLDTVMDLAIELRTGRPGGKTFQMPPRIEMRLPEPRPSPRPQEQNP